MGSGWAEEERLTYRPRSVRCWPSGGSGSGMRLNCWLPTEHASRSKDMTAFSYGAR
uniref:Uncharacterized protein n=1 Tax=Pseudomonas phage PACT201 TaxID=3230130 RepID=A0AAU8GTR8_9VIRU